MREDASRQLPRRGALGRAGASNVRPAGLSSAHRGKEAATRCATRATKDTFRGRGGLQDKEGSQAPRVAPVDGLDVWTAFSCASTSSEALATVTSVASASSSASDRRRTQRARAAGSGPLCRGGSLQGKAGTGSQKALPLASSSGHALLRDSDEDDEEDATDLFPASSTNFPPVSALRGIPSFWLSSPQTSGNLPRMEAWGARTLSPSKSSGSSSSSRSSVSKEKECCATPCVRRSQSPRWQSSVASFERSGNANALEDVLSSPSLVFDLSPLSVLRSQTHTADDPPVSKMGIPRFSVGHIAPPHKRALWAQRRSDTDDSDILPIKQQEDKEPVDMEEVPSESAMTRLRSSLITVPDSTNAETRGTELFTQSVQRLIRWLIPLNSDVTLDTASPGAQDSAPPNQSSNLHAQNSLEKAGSVVPPRLVTETPDDKVSTQCMAEPATETRPVNRSPTLANDHLPVEEDDPSPSSLQEPIPENPFLKNPPTPMRSDGVSSALRSSIAEPERSPRLSFLGFGSTDGLERDSRLLSASTRGATSARQPCATSDFISLSRAQGSSVSAWNCPSPKTSEAQRVARHVLSVGGLTALVAIGVAWLLELSPVFDQYVA